MVCWQFRVFSFLVSYSELQILTSLLNKLDSFSVHLTQLSLVFPFHYSNNSLNFHFCPFAKVIHILSRLHHIPYLSTQINSTHLQTPFYIINLPIHNVFQSLHIQNIFSHKSYLWNSSNCINYCSKLLLFISYPVRNIYLLECRYWSILSYDPSSPLAKKL